MLSFPAEEVVLGEQARLRIASRDRILLRIKRSNAARYEIQLEVKREVKEEQAAKYRCSRV